MKIERVKKSLEKSKNVPEKRKSGQAKNMQIKYQNVYNNCYELRSRAIKYLLDSRRPNGHHFLFMSFTYKFDENHLKCMV